MAGRVATALAMTAGLASASLQGMYWVLEGAGQLQQVNWTSGEAVNVGSSLAVQGWTTTSCSPITVDEAGKFIYTLGKNTSLPAGVAPWTLLATRLQDGSVCVVVPAATAIRRCDAHSRPPRAHPLSLVPDVLVPIACNLLPCSMNATGLPVDLFPPSLDACAIAVAQDGSSRVYISAFPTDVSTGEQTLSMVRFILYGPSAHGFVTVSNATSVAGFGLGAPPAEPTTMVTDFTVWVTMTGGLLGVDATTFDVGRTLPVAGGATLTGLQYDRAQTAYALLYGGNATATGAAATDGVAGSARLVTFSDSGSGVPALNVAPGVLPVPDRPALVALMNDKRSFAVIAGGQLVVASLQGAVQTTVPAGADGVDPISVVYEPFVF